VLIAFGVTESHEPLLFAGGRVVTLNPAQPEAEAVALSHGRVAAVGSLEEVRRATPSAREIDLHGGVVLPALRDHHLHLQAIGFALLNRERGGSMFLDLSDVRSESQLVQRAAERAARLPPGSWIVGTSWNENYWDVPRMPTHHALSAALPENPAFLVRVDSHSALVNTAAMRRAGIAAHTPDPYGGRIHRLTDGSPSGILIERAVEPVLDAMPLPDDDSVRQATLLAARSLAARGYVEVWDAGIMHFPGLVAMNSPMERWLDILRDVDEREALPLSVNVMIPAPSSAAEGVLSGRTPRQFSPRVRFTHLKLYADGAFGSRGALMHEPYSDDPSNMGIARMSEPEMYDYSRRALAAGLDAAVHAIGDAAVERVLNVYERILEKDPSIAPRRLRLEHFSVATMEDIHRAARLGILLVAQPGFVWPMPNGLCMEDSRLGPERVKRAYAWRTLLDLGAEIAGSSDDYSLPPHALWNYHAAVTRTNPDGVPAGGWQPHERITPDEALRMFTRRAEAGGAWEGGMLETGAPADLVVLSVNPLAAEVFSSRVLFTIKGGNVVYRAQ
jgi:predicted amidohydrolase YtcJ